MISVDVLRGLAWKRIRRDANLLLLGEQRIGRDYVLCVSRDQMYLFLTESCGSNLTRWICICHVEENDEFICINGVEWGYQSEVKLKAKWAKNHVLYSRLEDYKLHGRNATN